MVTDEGWNRVKSRNGFTDALAEKCPLLLLRLVTMEHSLKMNNVTDNEARYIAEDRYHKVMMGPTRSLAEYSDLFEMCIRNMTTLECVGIPDEARQARHFLMKLDRDRYGGFMRDVINDDRNTTREMPGTRQAIIDGARMHIPAQMMRADVSDRQAMPMVYQLNEEQLQHPYHKYPCHKCKKYGHWARECKEKSAPKVEDDVKEGREAAVYNIEVEDDNEYTEDDLFGFAFKVTQGHSSTNKLHPREVALDSFANVILSTTKIY